MGVKKLGNLIYSDAPGSITYHSFREYSGENEVIDAAIQIYKSVLSIKYRTNGKDIIGKNGRMIGHIYGIFCKITRFLRNDINTIWVFDGKPPFIKKNTLLQRKKERKKTRKMFLKSDEEKKQFYNQSYVLHTEHINDIQKLLRLLGVPYIVAPEEAESVCADMNKVGYVDGVVTDDWDALLFGSQKMIKRLEPTYTKKNGNSENFDSYAYNNQNLVQEIHLDKILAELSLTFDEFIDFCLILGTDYCIGVDGLDPHKAYKKFIKSDRNVITFMEKLITKNINLKKIGKSGKYTISPNFLEQRYLARKYYKNPPHLHIDTFNTIPKLKWEQPDIKGLKKFLCDDIGLHIHYPDIERRINYINFLYNRHLLLTLKLFNMSYMNRLTLPPNDNKMSYGGNNNITDYIYINIQENIEQL